MNDQLHDELALQRLRELPSLRDRFAMAATEEDLLAFTPRTPSLNRDYGPKWRTEARYLFADAMIAAREEKK